MASRTQFFHGLILYTGIAGAIVLYQLGLPGTFILDDLANLTTIELLPDRPSLENYLHFIRSGESGPLGRPLALASFLLDYHHWPGNPAAFKQTSIGLHLICGLLMAWMLVLFLRQMDRGQFTLDYHSVAIGCACLWLLHPFNVSTTLYVVQRMNILSSLFVLCACVTYLKTRQLALRQPRLAIILALFLLPFFALAGVLSKENAALLPLFLLLMEYTLRLGGAATAPLWQRWSLVLLIVSSLLLVILIVWKANLSGSAFSNRGYGLSQHLLTEGRALVHYLYKILLPIRQGTGLFQDDFLISQDVIRPITGLFSILFLPALLWVGWFFRKIQPLLFFAIFWFFAGHLMESGLINLEAYFEHRNYLPMLGPLLFLTYFLLASTTSSQYRILRVGFIGLMASSTFALYLNTSIWGDPVLAAETWHREHPESYRANQYATNTLLALGYPKKAFDLHLAHASRTREELPAGWYYNQILMHCTADIAIDRTILLEYGKVIESSRWDGAAAGSLRKVFYRFRDQRCTILKPENIFLLARYLEFNPSMWRSKTNVRYLAHLLAEIYLYFDDPQSALEVVQKADKRTGHIDVKILLAQVYYHLNKPEKFRETMKSIESRAEILPTLSAPQRKKIAALKAFVRQ